jgi:RNA polymerase sigma-70 factor, ECF subfamily
VGMNPDVESRDKRMPWMVEGSSSDIDRSFFLQYCDRLHALISLRLDPRLRGRVDTADVMQEVYLEYARCVAEYRKSPQLPPYLWLRMIAIRKLHAIHRQNLEVQARDARREKHLDTGPAPQASSFEIASQLIGRHSTPSNQAMRAELQAQVQAALNELSPTDREVLSLRHFELMSNSEIAATLGISEATASNRYMRALRRIKSVLGEIEGG